MRRVTLSWVTCLPLPYFFPHYLINGTIFGKKFPEHKICFDFALQILSEIFLILKRVQRDINILVLCLHIEYSLFLTYIKLNWTFFFTFSKNMHILIFMKIPAVGSEFFTYEETDTRKLRAAFRNFANAPKNNIFKSVFMDVGRV